MNQVESRGGTGIRPWVLLVAIGVALVAALGFAKPAWATSSPQTDAKTLAKAINSSAVAVDAEGASSASVTYSETANTVNVVKDISSPSETITVAPESTLVLNIAQDATLNLSNTKFTVNGGAPLTVNGPGEIKGAGGRVFSVVNGNNVESIATLNLNGVTVTSTDDSTTLVVVDEGSPTGNNSVLNVENCTMTAADNAAVLVKAGTANIKSGNLSNTTGTGQVVQAGMHVTIGTPGVADTPVIASPEGIGVAAAYMSNLTIEGGKISGVYGLAINNNSTVENADTGNAPNSNVSVTINGGTITGKTVDGSAIRLGSGGDNDATNASDCGQIDLNIVGGTLNAPVNQYGETVGPAIQNNSVTGTYPAEGATAPGANDITVGIPGSSTGPQINGDIVNAPATDDQGKNIEGTGAANVTVASGTVDGNVETTSGSPANVTVDGGNVTGDVENGGSGTTSINNGSVGGDVINSGSGTAAVNGGTVAGKLENTGEGTTTWTGGEVAGGTSGDVNVVPPETTPGSPEAVTGTVSGVVGPVAKEMAPYGTVTVSSDTYTWNVDITAPETPLATVAGVLVSPVVNAVGAAGATYAESVQNGQINIGLPAAPASVNAFATLVLQDAVANLVTTSLDSSATLGDLDGMTAGIRVTTNTGSLVYTFNFGEGVTPTPPAPQGDVTVYRLYNQWEGTHLYTTDVDEVKANVRLGWTNEGPYWYAPAAGTDAASYLIVRLYNPYNSGHYYVPASDTAQINYLTGLGWVEDSSAASFWSAAAGTDCPVFTLFNPYNTVDTHLYTPKSSEVTDLTALGWVEQTTVIYAASLPAEE